MPILNALGWSVFDPVEVHHEFKATKRDSPVDYALCLAREPRLLVEAKGLGEDFNDRKALSQVLGYATVAGVGWCTLTDGDHYCIYNASAPVDAADKLLCRVQLSTASEDESIRVLGLLSRASLSRSLLDELWIAHFVDRRVKTCVARMVDTPDKGLVRLIQKREPKLKPKQIAQSLRRLTFQVDSPAVAQPTARKPAPGRKVANGKKRALGKQREEVPVALVDLIAAGVLQPPLRLYRKYKGRLLEGELQPDGKVAFKGTVYESSSKAAEMARAVVTGRPMNTNGWMFWQFDDGGGKKQTLFQAREKFVAMKGPK